MLKIKPHHLTTLAIFLLVVATLFRLGHVELRGEEPRRAVVALEMLDSGSYIVPTMSGHTYYNKPPVFNWAVAASLRLFPGTESWMVRLPSLISWFLIGLMTFLITDRLTDRRTAIFASLFYLTSGELLFYGTVMTGELDLFYSLIVQLQVTAILWFLLKQQWTALFVISYALAAVGFLTKGLPSIAFQGLTVVATLIAFRQARRLIDARHLLGLATFAAITGGYLYAYSRQEPVLPFLISLFSEATQRTGLESKFGELIAGTFNFPLVVFKLLLPWSLLAIWLKGKDTWRVLWANPWTKFCLIFCAANMPLYWFSGELRNRYVYAFFPFVLIPIAHAYSINRDRRPTMRKWTDGTAAFILAALVVGAIAVPFIEPFREFSGVRPMAAIWALIGVALFTLHRRHTGLRIPVFVLALVIARLAFDVAYLPAMNLSRVSAYPPHIELMVGEAGSEPIHLAGSPESLTREATIGPLEFGEVQYTIPPSIAYQIAWHYARLSGHPMMWTEHPRTGDWCLIAKDQVDTNLTALIHEFRDHWTNRELAFVRWGHAGD